MNLDEIAMFQERYSRLTEDELSALIERMTVAPQSITDSARIALQQVVAERGISIRATIRERETGLRQDAALLE